MFELRQMSPNDSVVAVVPIERCAHFAELNLAIA